MSTEVSDAGSAAPEVPGFEHDAFWMGEGEVADSAYLDDQGHLPPELPEQEEMPEPVDQQAWSTDSLNKDSWVDLALGGV